jgi:hypothetical protein
MDSLTLLGVCAVSAMLVFYALEERGPAFVLGFAGACLFAAFYGALVEAWPFAVVETVWAAVAYRRYRQKARLSPAAPDEPAGPPVGV